MLGYRSARDSSAVISAWKKSPEVSWSKDLFGMHGNSHDDVTCSVIEVVVASPGADHKEEGI